MDYKRVYAEFIKDRREKEARLEGYSERHHIVPRALGGGDEVGNLIRLTAEDHFFAHLVLAKIHGGKMISALWRMLQRTGLHWGRRDQARRSYGTAQRIVVRYLKIRWIGGENPLFNSTLFRWWNYRTEVIEEATLYDMHIKYGGSRAAWTSVISGEKPSNFGWMPEDRRDDHRRSEKGKRFSFVNRDGRTFSGTQNDFSKFIGLNAASCSRIVRRASVTECGWRLDGTQDRRANGPKDGRRSSRLGTGRTYHLVNCDGRIFSGTCEEFRVFLGKPVGFSMSVRLGGLVRGAAPTLYGWSIKRDAS